MSALRQRAVCLARQTRPTSLRNTRGYASDAHGSHGHHDSHHHASHNVKEHFGPGFYVTLAVIPASMIVYSLAKPSEDGHVSGFTDKIRNIIASNNEEQARINTLHTDMMEQAAHDKHLLYYVPRNRHIDLKYPEVFQTGSQMNVPAGHYVNLDKVVAHYRQQHLDMEEQKVKKLAASKQE